MWKRVRALLEDAMYREPEGEARLGLIVQTPRGISATDDLSVVGTGGGPAAAASLVVVAEVSEAPAPEPILPPVLYIPPPAPSLSSSSSPPPLKDGMRDTTDEEKELLWLQSKSAVHRDGLVFAAGLWSVNLLLAMWAL